MTAATQVWWRGLLILVGEVQVSGVEAMAFGRWKIEGSRWGSTWERSVVENLNQ
jgi:hypothetical protein